jgi:hypothetical protein
MLARTCIVRTQISDNEWLASYVTGKRNTCMNSPSDLSEAPVQSMAMTGAATLISLGPNLAVCRDAERRALFAQIDKQVEDRFFLDHDRDRPLHRKALDLHMEGHRLALRAKRRGRRVCAIADAVVVRSIVEHRVLDACENLAILERKAAAARLAESEKHVVAELCQHQGCVLGEDESIDIHRLEVIRKGKVEEVSELKSLVQFCQQLSSEEASVPLEAVCNGSAVPVEVRARDDFKTFLSDLGMFLANEGDNGRTLARKVCEEHAFAERIMADAGQPKPVRFLASISLKVQACGAPKSSKGQRGWVQCRLADSGHVLSAYAGRWRGHCDKQGTHRVRQKLTTRD